jgi:hypothetical protein
MKRHPLTGESIEPVGFLPSGKCVWPVMGGAPDDDDDKKDDVDADKVDDDGKDDPEKPSSDGDDAVATVTAEEYERLKARMRAADKRADEAAAELKKAEDAKKDDLTKATDRVTELETTVEELSGTVRSLRLENAFLTSNKHEWHDPEIAMGIAQSKGFIGDDVVGDDGSVDKPALTKALDRLAKEHTYLVKSKSKKPEDAEPDGPSGEPAGGRSDNGKDSAAQKAQLKSRFPVLNR